MTKYNTKISNETREKIKKLFVEDGLSYQRIATELGLRLSTVASAVRNAGWKGGAGKYSVSDEDRAKLKELYSSGMSVPDIAKELGVSQTTIISRICRYKLRRAGRKK